MYTEIDVDGKLTTELYPFQEDCFNRVSKFTRHFIGTQVGTGKTLIAFKLIEYYLKTYGNNLPVYIFCPKSALVTWLQLIKKHTTFQYECNQVTGTTHISFIEYSKAQNVLYDIDLKYESLIILDESSLLKSSTSQIAKFFRGDLKCPGSTGILDLVKWVYGLSATYMVNHIEDIYYMINSLFKGFFNDLESFMLTYTVRRDRSVYRNGRCIKFKEVIGFTHLDKLEEILKMVMYSYSTSYNLEFIPVKVELPEPEMSLYNTAAKGFLENKSQKEFVARLPDLQLVVNGSVLLDKRYNLNLDLTAKEQSLVRIINDIEKRGEGAIIFTSFLTSMERFKRIRTHMPAVKMYYMTGASSLEDRIQIEKQLSPREFLFSSQVGSSSLNFQAVNNVIFFDIPWSTGDIQQTIGRITRIDTTYDILRVYLIIANETIDEYKYNLFCTNMKAANTLIKDFRFLQDFIDKAVTKKEIIKMRKELLWRSR